MKPVSEYNNLQEAYDFFNRELFDNELPVCMITLQRKARAGGYFWSEKFIDRTLENYTDEIALNPDEFHKVDDLFILSILVHEMCHLWQAHFDEPSRNGYHNMVWARKMLEVGLKPFAVNNPAKMTGQRVSHEIIVEGAFEECAKELQATGYKLTWQSRPDGSPTKEKERKKKKQSKTKYTCPNCETNAWAKLDTYIICGDCQLQMIAKDQEEKAQEEEVAEQEE